MESWQSWSSTMVRFYLFYLSYFWSAPWCYTQKIGKKSEYVLEDPIFEICSSNIEELVSFSRFVLFSECISHFDYIFLLIFLEWVKATVPYERLPNFSFFLGKIGHIFTRCDMLKVPLPSSKFLANEFPFLESLGVSDKSDPKVSYHQNLVVTTGFKLFIICLSRFGTNWQWRNINCASKC